MKTRIFTLFTVISLAFFACKKDEEVAVFNSKTNIIENNNIIGGDVNDTGISNTPTTTPYLNSLSISNNNVSLDSTYCSIGYGGFIFNGSNKYDKRELHKITTGIPDSIGADDHNKEFTYVVSEIYKKGVTYIIYTENVLDSFDIYHATGGTVKLRYAQAEAATGYSGGWEVSFSNLIFKSKKGKTKILSTKYRCNSSERITSPNTNSTLPTTTPESPDTTSGTTTSSTTGGTSSSTTSTTSSTTSSSTTSGTTSSTTSTTNSTSTTSTTDSTTTGDSTVVDPPKQVADLQITEFATEGSAEWVEIYNNSSFSVDLADYYVTELGTSGLSSKQVLNGTILPGEYLVIIDNGDVASDFTSRWTSFNYSKAIIVSSFSLVNGANGDEIIIGTDLNSQDQILDQVKWANSTELKALHGGTIPSNSSDVTASKQTNGSFASASGSPGAANNSAISVGTTSGSTTSTTSTTSSTTTSSTTTSSSGSTTSTTSTGTTTSSTTSSTTSTTSETKPGEKDIKQLNQTISENFDGWTAKGFSSSPGTGQLSSENWKIKLSSTKTTAYGGEHTNSDFSDSGTPSKGSASAGLHSYQPDFDNASDLFMGVKSSSSIMTPGYFEFRIKNNSGSTITSVDVSYLIRYMNSGNRSNSFNLSYSTNGSTFTKVSDLDFATPLALAFGDFSSTSKSTTINGISVASGSYFYLRWDSDDAGSDTGDDFGIDNLSVTPH